MSLAGNGAVIVNPSQTITLPTRTLYAFIGEKAAHLISNIIGAEYTVKSNPKFEVSVEGNILKVMSSNTSDIGTHNLKMKATT
jgi:hypothetical protein